MAGSGLDGDEAGVTAPHPALRATLSRFAGRGALAASMPSAERGALAVKRSRVPFARLRGEGAAKRRYEGVTSPASSR